NVDVLVTTKDGQFISTLKKDNFKVLEDGVPQTISNFNVSEAPITAVLLVEFASTNYYFMVDALNASYSFANSLKKNDWVAVISYDMRPHILADFTQDKRAVYGALNQLRIPGFAEPNLFDALYDTLDRLYQIEGRAYFHRFQGELPEIFHDISGDIRNEYNLAYRPTNPKLDGSYRKLKVEVVGPDGSPLKVRDQKGKDVKYQIVAREGYTAKH